MNSELRYLTYLTLLNFFFLIVILIVDTYSVDTRYSYDRIQYTKYIR
jgi:hypothetical protein